jgi:hypothetical protein
MNMYESSGLLLAEKAIEVQKEIAEKHGMNVIVTISRVITKKDIELLKNIICEEYGFKDWDKVNAKGRTENRVQARYCFINSIKLMAPDFPNSDILKELRYSDRTAIYPATKYFNNMIFEKGAAFNKMQTVLTKFNNDQNS